MAAENLKEFVGDWVIFGLLFFALISFAVVIVANNNEDALGYTEDKYTAYSTEVETNLLELQDTSNSLLNISSESDPEVSDLGSKDSVATSYGMYGESKKQVKTFALFFRWVFSGAAGKIIIGTLIGLIGFGGIYFIYKLIRNGV